MIHQDALGLLRAFEQPKHLIDESQNLFAIRLISLRSILVHRAEADQIIRLVMSDEKPSLPSLNSCVYLASDALNF